MLTLAVDDSVVLLTASSPLLLLACVCVCAFVNLCVCVCVFVSLQPLFRTLQTLGFAVQVRCVKSFWLAELPAKLVFFLFVCLSSFGLSRNFHPRQRLKLRFPLVIARACVRSVRSVD